MSQIPGLFGPSPRDPDEQRAIDENPGALDDEAAEDADTRNDTAITSSEIPVHDRTAQHAAETADGAAEAKREGANLAGTDDEAIESERQDSDATSQPPPGPRQLG